MRAGDIQAEVQYASKDTPLGRESYGLMMLVNILVPFLEHGLRPDWKSVLPAATVTSASARWLQNMAVKARSGRPAVYDMLQARPPRLRACAVCACRVPLCTCLLRTGGTCSLHTRI